MFIIIYILIFLLVLVTSSPSQKREFKEEDRSGGAPTSQIGNILTAYFYLMGKAWHKGERFKSDWIQGFVNDFYLNLPRELDPPTGISIPDYKVLSKGGTDDVSAWIVDTDEGKAFWDAMKPYVHNIIKESLEKSNLVIEQKNPVLHFRCSDGPFNRLGGYHFGKYQFFKDSLKGYKTVDIISCHTHQSSEENKVACKKYVDYLVGELESEGLEVNVLCEHYFEDFSRMFYAPLVISHGSSMSFMAGYFGHGKLLTTGHIWDEFAEFTECKICSHPRSAQLLHDEVADYYDVERVHQQLKMK